MNNSLHKLSIHVGTYEGSSFNCGNEILQGAL